MSDTAPTGARLALEDGCVFTGTSFGAAVDGVGEVVFNTSMSGYQEILTDPSYAGQIVCMTTPQIGNTGVNVRDSESGGPSVAGFVVKELSRMVSNFRSEQPLADYLADHDIPGITGIDTRALVRRLRDTGAMRGVLTTADIADAELVERARGAASMSGADWVKEVKPAARYDWSEKRGTWTSGAPVDGTGLHVVALDCGAKHNILRHLADRNVKVTVLPPDTSADDILAHNPDGLFVSNGPGDPAAVDYAVATLRALMDRRLPTFGICLGHQLLGRALGADTYKLKFGHRGGNQPVKDLTTGKVEITSQNHGFAVDRVSLEAAGGVVTHLHLNDQTVSGFRHADLPVFAVQYHPEASPGPHDAAYLFDRFVESMRTATPADTTK
ncbi:MAG: glutamine-hydrolyzing carbamoyl-phosphate synthase small subunit [Planctomycetota bacterium]